MNTLVRPMFRGLSLGATLTLFLVVSPCAGAAESSVRNLRCAGPYEKRNISLNNSPSLPDERGNATVSVTISLQSQSANGLDAIEKIDLVTSPNLGYLGFIGRSSRIYKVTDDSTNNSWRLRNEYEDEVVIGTHSCVCCG